MKERPILFSAPMVRALLDGSKTQTRRVVKGAPNLQPSITSLGDVCGGFCDSTGKPFASPYGQPGERLWVREDWRTYSAYDHESGKAMQERLGCSAAQMREVVPVEYAADSTRRNWLAACQTGRRREARFMPRWASRILLEVVSVRVERLQAINEVDALAEGIGALRTREWDLEHFPEWRREFDEACDARVKPPVGPMPSQVYRALWEQINGAGSWDANPWVWVVEFKRVAA